MSSGFRDFSVTLGSRILLLIVGIGTQSCLAWFLGKAGRGSYAVCLMYATLLSIFFTIGCDIASVYFVSSKRFTVSEGIVYVSIYGGIGSGLAVVTGMILMQVPLSLFDKAGTTAFYLALASIPISLFSFTFVRLLTAVQEFGWYAVMSVLQALMLLLFTVLYVCGLSLGVNGAFLAIITAGGAIIVGTLFLFWSKHRIKWVSPSLNGLLEMLHYGARYYVGKIGNTVNFQIGTIILALLATKEQVGLFAVASLMATRTMIIPNTLITVLVPKASEDEGGRKELIAQCSRLTGLMCGILLLVLAIFAKPIVAAVFSPSFLPAVPLFRILAVGAVVRSMSKIFVPYLLGTNRPGITSISVALGAAANLVTLWVLLPRIGLPGAAIGMVAGWLASSILLTISFVRFSGLGPTKIWRFNRSDWRIVGSALKRLNQTILGNQVWST